MLIASLVERGTRVLDIGCGNGELMELLVAERGVDARAQPWLTRAFYRYAMVHWDEPSSFTGWKRPITAMRF